MKKITDKGQLIFCLIMTSGLFILFSFDLFYKASDGSKYSFYEMMGRISSSGIVLWVCTFLLIAIVLIFSFIQSFITHKKNGYTLIKEITSIAVMIILCLEIKFINKLTLAYSHIDTINYWIVILFAIIYPLGLYICDYVHSVITAK
ncbi:MAG: hypothetical protein ACI4U5_05365 [Bacilli bacterium]